jgi:hypothetical protein
MPTTYKAFTSKMGGANPVEYIGRTGEIFWDPASGSLRLSDGSTAGGIAITGVSNGFQARNNTPTATASALGADSYATLDLTAHKGYVLYSINADKPCWVRLYDSNASRLADQNRVQGTPPSANSGVIAEAVFVSAGTVSFTPGVFAYNNESTPTTTAPIAVTNTGGTSQDIGINLTVLKLEQG